MKFESVLSSFRGKEVDDESPSKSITDDEVSPYLSRWSNDNVENWLVHNGMEKYVNSFRNNDIDGEVLLLLRSRDLKKLGVEEADTKEILSFIFDKKRLERQSDPRRYEGNLSHQPNSTGTN